MKKLITILMIFMMVGICEDTYARGSYSRKKIKEQEEKNWIRELKEREEKQRREIEQSQRLREQREQRLIEERKERIKVRKDLSSTFTTYYNEAEDYNKRFEGTLEDMLISINNNPNSYKESIFYKYCLRGSDFPRGNEEFLKEEILVKLMDYKSNHIYLLENRYDLFINNFLLELKNNKLTNERLRRNIQELEEFNESYQLRGSASEMLEQVEKNSEIWRYSKYYMNEVYDSSSQDNSNITNERTLINLIMADSSDNAFSYLIVNRENPVVMSFLSEAYESSYTTGELKDTLELLIKRINQADFGGTLEEMVGQINTWSGSHIYGEYMLGRKDRRAPYYEEYHDKVSEEEILVNLLYFTRNNDFFMENLDKDPIKNFIEEINTLEISSNYLNNQLNRLNGYINASKLEGDIGEIIEKLSEYPDAYKYNKYYLDYDLTDKFLKERMIIEFCEIEPRTRDTENLFIMNRKNKDVKKFIKSIKSLEIEDEKLLNTIKKINEYEQSMLRLKFFVLVIFIFIYFAYKLQKKDE